MEYPKQKVTLEQFRIPIKRWYLMVNFIGLISYKMRITTFLLFVYFFTNFLSPVSAQTSNLSESLFKKENPWKESDLIQPLRLAAILENPKAKQPMIYNIGVSNDILHTKNVGAASETENLEKFKKQLTLLPKNTYIVIYCGCCPFEKCPNIRPAFTALQSLGFTNAKLLNLPVNLQTNWVKKGYPLQQ